jgi:hypothetical protein
MPYRLILIGIPVIGLLASSFTEAGPFKIAVIIRRFSWIGVPVSLFILFWFWCTFLFVLVPDIDTDAVIYSSLVLTCSVMWITFCERVLLRHHLNKGITTRAYRRIRFRLRWDSIAKSCGMANDKDVRPHDWWKGGTIVTRQYARAVQWTPTLWHGRRGADDTTQYLIRPARGMSDKHWTDIKDGSTANDLTRAIAIAANAKMCSFSPSNKNNWWTLTVFWTDPSSYRPRLED